jgi:hypothetical protein
VVSRDDVPDDAVLEALSTVNSGVAA